MNFGIRACETPFKGGVIYADITPSSQPWYRRVLPGVQFWWFEILVDGGTEDGHYYEYDGGAWTFQGAVRKASKAIERIESDE